MKRKIAAKYRRADGARVTVYTDGAARVDTPAGARLMKTGKRIELLSAADSKPRDSFELAKRFSLESMQRILRLRI